MLSRSCPSVLRTATAAAGPSRPPHATQRAITHLRTTPPANPHPLQILDIFDIPHRLSDLTTLFRPSRPLSQPQFHPHPSHANQTHLPSPRLPDPVLYTGPAHTRFSRVHAPGPLALATSLPPAQVFAGPARRRYHSHSASFTTSCLDLDAHDPARGGHIADEPTLTILSVLLLRNFLWLREAGLLQASIDWRRNAEAERRRVD
ncbi:hypothetical protein DENSPDRAFT_931720 [Dentipellis sp. KUC8613]|nr:hypothetical protein DENSPDRAFT_931720 [Dentipellis sp. KUC8613]